ncbi:MAG: hypothetical protein AAGA11_00065 [Pseudomonadota bacterium]
METERLHRSETPDSPAQVARVAELRDVEVPATEALVQVDGAHGAVAADASSPGLGFSMLIVVIVAALAAVAIMRRPVRPAESDRAK